MVLFGGNGCIRAKGVEIVQKWLYSGQVVLYGKKILKSGRVDVFGKKKFIREKLDVLGKKWLYSGKCGNIRAEKGCIRAKVVVFWHSGYFRAKEPLFG